MTEETKQLTNLDPRIKEFQNSLLRKYDQQNKHAKLGQIDFVGSSLMEIFPIEKFQTEQSLGLKLQIYNRGVRATTTADLLAHMDTQIFDLKPAKIFINIGSNDIGFNVPEKVFLANYDSVLSQIHEKLPDAAVYVMAYYPINTTADFGEEKDEHSRLYEHRSNQTYTEASKKVEQLANKHAMKFINVNKNLTDAQGNLKSELTFDGAHMLPAGYQIVLQNLLPFLRE